MYCSDVNSNNLLYMDPVFILIPKFNNLCIRPDDSPVLVSLTCGSLSGIASSTGE